MAGPAIAFSSQQYIPWPESVTYTRVFSNPSLNVVTPVNDAGVYQLGNQEGAPSQGVFTKFTIEVTIAQTDVPSTPKPADLVQWLGNTYTVQRVQSFDWLGFHKLTALNLILALDLVQSGTLTRPNNAADSTMKPNPTGFTTIALNVPCRLQPTDGTAGDVQGRRTMPQQFTTYVGGQFVPQAKDRFTVNGVKYTVKSWAAPQRIDTLMTLELELLQ